MMGLSAGAAEETVTLDTLKDPKAFAAKLKQLNDVKDQAKLIYEQAKNENVGVVAERKKAEELNASTMAALQEINDKRAEILKIQDGIAYHKQELDTREGGLNAREATLEANEKALAAEVITRKAALEKAEAAFAAKMEADKNAMANELAAKSAALDAAHKQRSDDVAKYVEKVQAKERLADAAKEMTDNARAVYEEKLASLKKIVG